MGELSAEKHGALLDVRELTLAVGEGSSARSVVDRVSFAVEPGESVALVGESGSGKSLTALAVLDLLPKGVRMGAGEVMFDSRRIGAPRTRIPGDIRGKRIGIVFQDPLDALDPTMRVGQQVREALALGGRVGRERLAELVLERLAEVGIPEPRDKARMYPHELSGGQRQRVLIAIALAHRPELLIADEPTTALDVTIQRQIVDLLLRLRTQHNMAMLFISHDLALVAEVASRIVVMYNGQIMEQGAVEDVYERPLNPYTQALLASIPGYGAKASGGLTVAPPEGTDESTVSIGGCSFASRCPARSEVCTQARPVPVTVKGSATATAHSYSCHNPLLDEGAEFSEVYR